MLWCPVQGLDKGVCYFSLVVLSFLLVGKGFSPCEEDDSLMLWARRSHVFTLPETGSLSVPFSDQQQWHHLELVGYSVSGALCWTPESDSLEMGLKCVIVSSPADAHAPQSARTSALHDASLNGLPSSMICGLRWLLIQEKIWDTGLWTSQHSPWPRTEGTRTFPNFSTQVNVY